MVNFIAIGCLAFVCYGIFDLNKIKFIHKRTNILVILGSVALAFSTLAIACGEHSAAISTLLHWIELLGSMLALVLLIYSIFGAIPLKPTYLDTRKGNTVVNTGMYSLCRHPGVIWFFLFYFLLSLALRNTLMFKAALVWTCLDIIYVYIQDRWIFPIILEDYQAYQEQVPFLIPKLTGFRSYCRRYRKGN